MITIADTPTKTHSQAASPEMPTVAVSDADVSDPATDSEADKPTDLSSLSAIESFSEAICRIVGICSDIDYKNFMLSLNSFPQNKRE